MTTTWLQLKSLYGNAKDPTVVGGNTAPFRLDELEDDLNIVLQERRPYAGAASSAPGTLGGGATGSVVIWGPDLLTVLVHPPRPRVGRWMRFELRGETTTFQVHCSDGQVLIGELNQPGTQTGLRRVFGGWTRTALTVRARVAGRTMFMSGKGYGGFKVRTADGRPIAEATWAGARIAHEADAVERSVALALALALALKPRSYLPFSTS